MNRLLKNTKRWLPGAIISVGLAAIILNAVDLPSTIDAIRSADYSLLLVAVTLNVVWLLVRGMVWRTLLQDQASYRDVFVTLGEGYLMNNFLPFRLGEVGRAFLLSRKSKMSFTEIIPTIVVERVFDLAISAAILVGVVPFVSDAAGTDRIGFVVGGIVLAGLGALYLLTRNQAWAMKTFESLSARWPKLQQLGGNLVESVFAGLSVLTDGWLFIRFLFWMLANWIIAIFQYYFIVAAFFPQATLVWGMFGLGAAAFGGAVPSLPGALGTLEAAIGGALNLLSGDWSTALAVALTVRLFNYVFSGVVGIYGLSNEGQTLSGIYQQLMNFRNKGTMRESGGG
ncbi:MAG: flippase-like domain-containing protein [Chloroflexi bacterium]|nr:flippase-like domain-containing protein [Chloroflexota bacterium]